MRLFAWEDDMMTNVIYIYRRWLSICISPGQQRDDVCRGAALSLEVAAAGLNLPFHVGGKRRALLRPKDARLLSPSSILPRRRGGKKSVKRLVVSRAAPPGR